MKSSYKLLRIITYILRIVGAITFLLSLFYFCIVLYLWKAEGQYISNTQEIGLTVYAIIIGLVLFLVGAVIALLCDIADNAKRIAEKQWTFTALPFDQKGGSDIQDHSKYMPKSS
ncbi:MAG: hypothetical protein WC756_06660 [Taibaiella sp.]|jgi:hypothetical protein